MVKHINLFTNKGGSEMVEETERKEYTLDDRLKIVERSKYIRIVKNKKDLKDDDIFIPIKEKGKTVYMVAVKE